MKMQDMEMITLKTFDNAIHAHLLKSRLESEGIPCYLFDENINTLNPLYNMATGGIKLKISSLDYPRAEAILAEIEDAVPTDDKGEIIHCSQCGSENLYSGFKSMRGIRGFLSAVVSFLLMVFPIYYRTVYKCKDCGYEFEKKSE